MSARCRHHSPRRRDAARRRESERSAPAPIVGGADDCGVACCACAGSRHVEAARPVRALVARPAARSRGLGERRAHGIDFRRGRGRGHLDIQREQLLRRAGARFLDQSLKHRKELGVVGGAMLASCAKLGLDLRQHLPGREKAIELDVRGVDALRRIGDQPHHQAAARFSDRGTARARSIPSHRAGSPAKRDCRCRVRRKSRIRIEIALIEGIQLAPGPSKEIEGASRERRLLLLIERIQDAQGGNRRIVIDAASLSCARRACAFRTGRRAPCRNAPTIGRAFSERATTASSLTYSFASNKSLVISIDPSTKRRSSFLTISKHSRNSASASAASSSSFPSASVAGVTLTGEIVSDIGVVAWAQGWGAGCWRETNPNALLPGGASRSAEASRHACRAS